MATLVTNTFSAQSVLEDIETYSVGVNQCGFHKVDWNSNNLCQMMVWLLDLRPLAYEFH